MKLKPEMFVFKGDKVDGYIAKLEHLVTTCGEQAVLANLSVGIISNDDTEGARWFMALTGRERDDLAANFDNWPTMLRARFRKDRGDLMQRADEMGHSFDRENELGLWAYIDEKVHLYNEAGDVDEDAQVRRIHAKLDPDLRVAVSLRETGNTLADFRKSVQRNQFNVRQQWQENKKKTDARDNEMDRLRREISRLSQGGGYSNRRYDKSSENNGRTNSSSGATRDYHDQDRGRWDSRGNEVRDRRDVTADKTQGAGRDSKDDNKGPDRKNSGNKVRFDNQVRNYGAKDQSAKDAKPGYGGKSGGQNRYARSDDSRPPVKTYLTKLDEEEPPNGVVDEIQQHHHQAYVEDEDEQDEGQPSSSESTPEN